MNRFNSQMVFRSLCLAVLSSPCIAHAVPISASGTTTLVNSTPTFPGAASFAYTYGGAIAVGDSFSALMDIDISSAIGAPLTFPGLIGTVTQYSGIGGTITMNLGGITDSFIISSIIIGDDAANSAIPGATPADTWAVTASNAMGLILSIGATQTNASAFNSTNLFLPTDLSIFSTANWSLLSPVLDSAGLQMPAIEAIALGSIDTWVGVPEPMTFSLLASGLLGLALFRRRPAKLS